MVKYKKREKGRGFTNAKNLRVKIFSMYKKIVSILVLGMVLAMPAAALAQSGRPAMNICKLRHDLSKYIQWPKTAPTNCDAGCSSAGTKNTPPTNGIKNWYIGAKGASFKKGGTTYTFCSVPGCYKETAGPGNAPMLTPPPKGENAVFCLIDLVLTVEDWIFTILLVVAFLFIIWGAIGFVTSGGDPEKVTGARNRMIWALVGIVTAFISKGLVNLIVQVIQ